MSRAWVAILRVALAVPWASASAAAGDGAGVPVPEAVLALAREGMRANLAGDFAAADAVWARMRALDPAHPAAAVFETDTLYWQQMFDDEDRAFDEPILARTSEAERLARARLEADPDDTEAHYWLAQALMMRGRLEGIRGRFVRAGTHGEEAREHLERVIAEHPDWTDAKYQLGLYYFYASLAPKLVTRWLGWLWFVPSGDGPTGLRYLAEVVREGDVWREEARFILANIYTYHETAHRAEALRMVRDLHRRYPDNTLVHFELIEVLYAIDEYEAAAAEARRLESKPATDPLDRGRKLVATVWRARSELRLDRPDQAWETLEALGDGPWEHPRWAPPWIDLTRAQTLDVLGRRDDALAHYRRVRAYEPPHASRRASELASDGIDEPFTLPRRARIGPAS